MSGKHRYQICYYGLLAERRGCGEEWVESGESTAAGVYAELDSIYQLGLLPRDVRVAVNDEFSSWDHALKSGDRLAFLPPMSGG